MDEDTIRGKILCFENTLRTGKVKGTLSKREVVMTEDTITKYKLLLMGLKMQEQIKK
jgi:hypothetical protein